MKKITSIAAALAMATAFCGFCSGCANNIEKKGEEVAPVAVTASDTTASHKVVLNPGWYYNNKTKTMNTISTGASKLTAPTDNFLENAYECTVAVGEDLPTPTTGRSGVTFQGWRYAKGGNLITVTKMPATTSLENDMILYAHWLANNNGGGQTGTGNGSNNNGDNSNNGTETIAADSTKLTFSGGDYVILKLTGTSGKTNLKIHAWKGTATTTWPGIEINLASTTDLSAYSMSGISIIVNWGSASDSEKTKDITPNFESGATYTIACAASTNKVTKV